MKDECANIRRNFKEKNEKLDKQREEAIAIKNAAQGELNKKDQLIFRLENEKESLKQIIKKIKNRKAVDVTTKLCVNCGKEFNEKENYNWSCQKHRSTYGDHMWWCCGKLDKNAPGCKKQKHTTKEDNHLDDNMSDGG